MSDPGRGGEANVSCFSFSHQEEVSPRWTSEESRCVIMAALGNSGPSSSPMVILAPKTKTKKKHFVQQKVKVFRASDPVLSVFMWGVNHSVSPWKLT